MSGGLPPTSLTQTKPNSASTCHQGGFTLLGSCMINFNTFDRICFCSATDGQASGYLESTQIWVSDTWLIICLTFLLLLWPRWSFNCLWNYVQITNDDNIYLMYTYIHIYSSRVPVLNHLLRQVSFRVRSWIAFGSTNHCSSRARFPSHLGISWHAQDCDH